MFKFVFGATKKNFTEGSPFFIIPREHYVSSIVLDEDYSEELAEIKRALIDHYGKKEKSLVFFEIFKSGGHMVLEVLQVDKYMANSLRRLLLNEFEMNNDETSAKAYKNLSSVAGGLKRAIAEEIPYTWFAVDNEPGYLQRISKPEKFDNDFYYKVLGAELIDDFDEMQLAQKLTPPEVREKLKNLQTELENIK
ncbi:hypothetical protein FO519_000379 [Halicephalobus sp. NKZ332]|nr:hypothetical protein FO519_000379 [Halicephalobus sp. NKZ332]